MEKQSRREFVHTAASAMIAAGVSTVGLPSFGQVAGDRPRKAAGVSVINPRARVPVGWIMDDSTCLVNLNRFAMPQFDLTFEGKRAVYRRNWRDWPVEIPDAFVRKFGEWCAEQGVKGKYSIVPFPACVGRLDRFLPGWTQAELTASLELVRTVLMPNWDIHPEMVTHTRVIDLRTGQPYPDPSPKFMENWDWTTGRSVDELTEYLHYALSILKNVGLPCEGVTTPGGFGASARPQLAQATLQSVRDVFSAEIPHYFRDLYDRGDESVAPQIFYASGLEGPDPRCAVSILGCTGDWTGGWDCTPVEGPDRYITADLQRGRLVDVILRGEPALMVSHWTGIYWNGQELGFKVLQEVVHRLKQRFDNLLWMKLSEIARYWAARELTRIEVVDATAWTFRAPFACPDFTVQFQVPGAPPAQVRLADDPTPLKRVDHLLKLSPGTWSVADQTVTVCFALAKGLSQIRFS